MKTYSGTWREHTIQQKAVVLYDQETSGFSPTQRTIDWVKIGSIILCPGQHIHHLSLFFRTEIVFTYVYIFSQSNMSTEISAWDLYGE